MIHLLEPSWGVKILVDLHLWMLASHIGSQIIPLLADIFVFSYPIVLIIVYAIGLISKRTDYKHAAVWMFWVAILSTLLNILLQTLFTKERPDIVLELGIQKKEEMILYEYLPEASFPSDHAAMAVAIALAAWWWGRQNKQQLFVWLGVLRIVCAAIMLFARVALGIHWPTDILGGVLVGMIGFGILSVPKIYSLVYVFLIQRIVALQERLFGKGKSYKNQ